ncbi:glycoside hydrolase family 3 N-terminal domain-containing protein [Brachybacterium muris]|uniref:glycoside hydrolase family 3 N-terminal domain-containing protein n=1 Tax=Brachybacterium muris TaxID=219301 RepID=UPI0023EF2C5A|nr:glycoside hydrolase family 3 N-terminal domain-containing protein [Brachybacterium muris]
MRRRHLLALSPALALAACGAGGTDPQGTSTPALPDGPEATGPGGNAPASTGGDGTDGGEASPSEEAPSPWDPSEAVTALLDGLSPRQMAGQLVLVGIAAGGSIPPEVLTEHHAGGIFLLGVWRDPDQVDGIVTAAREGSDPQLPPLIAVDQEGGQVRMLRGDAARRTPSAKELGSAGPEAVREAYTTIGEDLAARGITVALSPVADVVDPQLGSGNDPVGGLDRGFGTDPEQVGDCVAGAVEALDATGTAATLKHFPGLGRVEQNTDHSAEGILDEVTIAGDPFMDSFAAGIDAGAELVMLSSATYARIDGQAPAMFSRAVVTDLLRDQLGFEGLTVTDDIGAAKAVASVPVAERATRFLDAGGDVLLTADPSITGALVDAIEEWATRGEEQAARVRASAGRMLTLKERRGLLGTNPD